MQGSHKPHLCPSFLVASVIFTIFTVSGIVSAAWVDAPNAPPNYGITGCTYPCEEEDFRPMNLGTTDQTKRANIIANGFLDRQDPTYLIDPESSATAGRFRGSVGIGSGPLSVGISTPLFSGAKIIANNPETPGKTGSLGDGIYSFANTTGSAVSAEQENPAGYALYASGTTSRFDTNVEIGSAADPKQLCLGGVCQSSWPSAGSGTTNTITKWTAPNVIGDSIITDDGTTVGVGGNLSVTGTANTCKKIPYAVSGEYQVGHSGGADPGSGGDPFAGGQAPPTTSTGCGTNYYLVGAINGSGFFMDPNAPEQTGSLLCCKNAD